MEKELQEILGKDVDVLATVKALHSGDEAIRKALGVDDKADVLATITASLAAGKAIRDKLGITQDADVLEAIGKLSVAPDLQAKVTDLEKQLNDIKATEVINQALKDRKILPKQAAWAKDYYLTDEKGFQKFLTEAPVMGPSLDIRGSEGDEVELTLTETKIGEKLGVKKEDLVKSKKEGGKS